MNMNSIEKLSRLHTAELRGLFAGGSDVRMSIHLSIERPGQAIYLCLHHMLGIIPVRMAEHLRPDHSCHVLGLCHRPDAICSRQVDGFIIWHASGIFISHRSGFAPAGVHDSLMPHIERIPGVEDEVMMINLDKNEVSVDMDTVFAFPVDAEKKLERTLHRCP
eukprot:SAG31_NODE_354_length_17223_cov_18.708771_16_plen_163_part_00